MLKLQICTQWVVRAPSLRETGELVSLGRNLKNKTYHSVEITGYFSPNRTHVGQTWVNQCFTLLLTSMEYQVGGAYSLSPVQTGSGCNDNKINPNDLTTFL